MHRRYLQSDDLAFLRDAVLLSRRAVAVTRENDPSLIVRLYGLGVCLTQLYELGGDQEAPIEAVAVWRIAIAVMPDDDPDMGMYLHMLSVNLLGVYENSGDLAVLDEAVAAGKASLAATRDDDADLADRLCKLGAILVDAFKASRDETALREAVELSRTAVAVAPSGHRNRDVYVEYLFRCALELRREFDRHRDLDDLRNAVVAGEAIVGAASSDELREGRYAFFAADNLHVLYQETGDAGVLRDALEAGRIAAAAEPADQVIHANRLASLSAELYKDYRSSGDVDVLRESVVVGRSALSRTAEDDWIFAERRARLVELLVSLGETGDMTARQEAVRLTEAVAKAAADGPSGGSPESGKRLASGDGQSLAEAGFAAWDKYRQRGDTDDLHQAVGLLRAAFSTEANSERKQVSCGFYLCVCLSESFDRTEDYEFLRELIVSARKVLSADDGEIEELRAGMLLMSSMAARRLGTYERDASCLAEAVNLARASLEAIAGTSIGHLDFVSNLGAALVALGVQTQDSQVLHEAVGICRIAVGESADDDPARPARAAGLRDALAQAYRAEADVEILRELAGAWRVVLSEDGRGAARELDKVFNHADALLDFWERTGDGALLDEAATTAGVTADALLREFRAVGDDDCLLVANVRLRGLLERLPDSYRGTAACLYREAVGQYEYAKATGEPDHLRVAVYFFARAVSSADDHDPERPDYVVGYAICLDELPVGVDWPQHPLVIAAACETTSAALPADDPRQAALLAVLAEALSASSGDRDLLNQAVSAARRALALLGSQAGDEKRARVLFHLSSALLALAAPSYPATLLDDAVDAARQAVILTSPDASARAGRLAQLGSCLLCRHNATGSGADLDAAIEASREAVTAAPEAEVGLIANLAYILEFRFSYAEDEPALRESIALYRQALVLTDNIRRPHCLMGLGIALIASGRFRDDENDLREAVDLLREAVASTSASESLRAESRQPLGRALVALAALRGDLDAMAQGIDELRQVLALSSSNQANYPKDMAELASGLGVLPARWPPRASS